MSVQELHQRINICDCEVRWYQCWNLPGFQTVILKKGVTLYVLWCPQVKVGHQCDRTTQVVFKIFLKNFVLWSQQCVTSDSKWSKGHFSQILHFIVQCFPLYNNGVQTVSRAATNSYFHYKLIACRLFFD